MKATFPSLIEKWRSRIVNIHIEDMVQGVHEHLMFGEGTMDFRSILRRTSPDRLRTRDPRRAEPPQPRCGRRRRKSCGVPQTIYRMS